jgi:uncharacterized RDD family membrane protein YckC
VDATGDAVMGLERPRQGHRAGLVSRAVADAVDFVVIAGVVASIYLGISALIFMIDPPGFRFPRVPSIVIIGACYVVAFLYLGIGWSATGRTVGKQLAGLRAVTAGGERMRPVMAFARALVCVFFPIGLVWCAVSAKNSAVEDVLLKTAVIYDWTSKVPRRSDGAV